MFYGLEPRRCDDIKGIVAPEIGPKSFGTFDKRAPDQRNNLNPSTTQPDISSESSRHH